MNRPAEIELLASSNCKPLVLRFWRYPGSLGACAPVSELAATFDARLWGRKMHRRAQAAEAARLRVVVSEAGATAKLRVVRLEAENLRLKVLRLEAALHTTLKERDDMARQLKKGGALCKSM